MEAFSVMSFNVRGAFPERHPERLWENRADLNTRTIQRHAPDLIGFQEVQSENTAIYAQHLTDYQYTTGRDRQHPGRWISYNPIYYKTARWTALASGGFFFSDTPEVWSKGWDGAFVRGATWVRLQSQQSGAEVIHINAHLDHLGEQARVESARLIAQLLPQISDGLPVILTADFNSRAWSPEDESNIPYPPTVHRDKLPPGGTVHNILTAAGFRDTYHEAGHQDKLDMNTFHGFLGENFPACALRIDWVLIRDGDSQRIMTEDFRILQDAEPPVYPSDHYPVMARLTLG